MNTAPRDHRLQLRWAFWTWLITTMVCSLYDLVLWSDLPAVSHLVRLHLVITVLACGTSLVAVWVVVRLPHLVPSVAAATAAGGVLALAWAAVTYGASGEELNGSLFRAFAGTLIGFVSGTVAWLLIRRAIRSGDC